MAISNRIRRQANKIFRDSTVFLKVSRQNKIYLFSIVSTEAINLLVFYNDDLYKMINLFSIKIRYPDNHLLCYSVSGGQKKPV